MWIVPSARHALDHRLAELKTQGIQALGFALSETSPIAYQDEEGLGLVTSHYTAQILKTDNPLYTFSYSAYKLLLARQLQVTYVKAKNALEFAEKLNIKPQKCIHYTSNISENLWYENLQKKGHTVVYKQLYQTLFADNLPKDVKEALSEQKRCVILLFSKASAQRFIQLCQQEEIELNRHLYVCISQQVADVLAQQQVYVSENPSLKSMVERAKNVI